MDKEVIEVAAEKPVETAAPKAVSVSVSELAVPDIHKFRGIFRAWVRNVPNRKTGEIDIRFKCVCTVPHKKNPDTMVDVTAWVSDELAAKRGIPVDGSPFVAEFAYTATHQASPKGQYNEEWALDGAVLIAVG